MAHAEKTWRRKAAEALVTLHLERTLTKEQIFEYYANNVDLGRRGTFQILGFGEASQAYFNKDVKKLTLPEAAMLAGLIRRPSSYTNPVRWPDRQNPAATSSSRSCGTTATSPIVSTPLLATLR